MRLTGRTARRLAAASVVASLAFSASNRPIAAAAPSHDQDPALARVADNPAIRAGSPLIRRVLAEGIARSPTFAGLVEDLAQTDVIVFVEPAIRLPHGAGGCLTLLSKTTWYRYVQIQMDLQLARLQAIAMLGHELQHAVEVADHPEVVDQLSLQAMYLQIGERRENTWRGHDLFDSAGAIAAGQKILRELTDAPALAGIQDPPRP